MAKIPFGKKAIKSLNNIIDTLFNSLKLRFLGPEYAKDKGNKAIVITSSYKPELTLSGIYKQAATEESTKPDPEVLAGLISIAEGYLDSQKEKTKAKVVKTVIDAVAKEENPKAVIARELAQVMGEVNTEVKRIAENEVNTAKNIGILEGITKISAITGVDDPTVAFLGPLDNETCEECKRVLWLPDQITPKVFKLSEVSHGYHKRGTDVPSMSGCHPACRSTLTMISRGFGFKNGQIAYISLDHDEYAAQRG